MTTQDTFSEHEITETLGLVTGDASWTRHIFTWVLILIHQLIGLRIGSFTKLMHFAREDATERLILAANKQGADGVVALRMTTTSIAGIGFSVLAYGTAVKFKKKPDVTESVVR
ncbi:MAG: YbjQ family protein [Alphaproteobacteria bacterium]|nr:YbjQ family protein [Alphaproteobacteria bacterium]